MSIRSWLAGMMLATCPSMAVAATLSDALALVDQQHPMLKIGELRIQAARGEHQEASSYAYNPEISLEPQRRRLAGGGVTNDYYLSLSQRIELFGKRGLRTRVADERLEAAQRAQQTRVLQLRVAVAKAFVDAYAAERMFLLRDKERAMMKRLLEAMERRLRVGEGNQLEVQAARAARLAAAQASLAADQERMRAWRRLNEGVGGRWEKTTLEMPPYPWEAEPPVNAVELAMRLRPDLEVLRASLQSARLRRALAEIQQVADPTLSIMIGREAGDRLVKFGVQIPLPLWNRHRGALQARTADALRLSDEQAWMETRIRLEVETALQRYRATRQALRQAGDSLADDGERLGWLALESGEIDVMRFIDYVRQRLQARRVFIELQRQAWLARIELAAAMGCSSFMTGACTREDVQ